MLGFAFLVKDLMIKEIDGFYDMLQGKVSLNLGEKLFKIIIYCLADVSTFKNVVYELYF